MEKLDTKNIGQTIAKIRLHKEIKAREIASQLNMSESNYTKYERGENDITISFINQVSEILQVSVFQILSSKRENVIENISDANIAIQATQNVQILNKEIIDLYKNQLAAKDMQIEKLLFLLQEK